ncbi:hypothetical protein SAZ_34965 [Streptomyces noursei ZPM]|nr:hypothetical protein SAZ_34965 [Streptomyces noursei ZPM]
MRVARGISLRTVTMRLALKSVRFPWGLALS